MVVRLRRTVSELQTAQRNYKLRGDNTTTPFFIRQHELTNTATVPRYSGCCTDGNNISYTGFAANEYFVLIIVWHKVILIYFVVMYC